MRSFHIAALLCALAAVCFADKVDLKDGRSYEGVVLEETDTFVKIKTAKATLTFQKDQVLAVVKVAGGALAERETKLAALDPAKPAGYLELANWITGKGKEAYDLPLLRRLCAAASKLDPKQAYEAQMVLGKKLEEAAIKREAALAYARAQFSKPGDPEARVRLDNLRQGLRDEAKKEMQELAAALDLVIAGEYAAALPKLQKAEGLAMAEEANTQIGMSIELLTKDVARRVQCKPCDGGAEVNCPACAGDGLITCNVCDGGGAKKGFKAGKDETGFADGVCRSCYGVGSILCAKCKAERDITITFYNDPAIMKVVPPITVHAKAQHELDAFRTGVDMVKYQHKIEKRAVISIVGGPATKGGRTPCGTCQGVKYDPPINPPPVDRIRAYLADVNDRANGQKPYEVVPRVTEVFDKSALADDCLRYRNGAWVK
ncbi:MAG: hypothetical protein FD180_3516 [Planctomycetota bacterium]|nr:MAG: hypothetical protein FD180_3516 [Planctomycetota bacterium]